MSSHEIAHRALKSHATHLKSLLHGADLDQLLQRRSIHEPGSCSSSSNRQTSTAGSRTLRHLDPYHELRIYVS